MAHSQICCGLFRGRFFLKDLSNPNAALLPVGNAEATINQTLTEITQPNFTSLGGNNCSVSYIDSMSLALTLHCTSPENMAIAFMGTSEQLTSGTVTDELHTVNAIHELIPFENAPNKTQPITVSTEDGATDYVLNTDYVVTHAGIEIIYGSTIPLGSVISVTYSHGSNWVINTQVAAQKTFLVVLDGVNVGESGESAVVMKAWRVKFAPTDSFALISGTDFASIALTGQILQDQTKVTGSKFMKFEYGDGSTSGY